MSHTRPTRRTVVRAAAWSAPAVVVASAAPAMAASTGGALSISLGTSAFVPFSNPQGSFYDVNLNGVTITTGNAVAAGTLQVVASFRPDVAWTTDESPGLRGMYANGAPSGWTSTPGSGAASSVTFIYAAAAAAGATIVVPTGTWVGTNYQTSNPKGQGFLDLTVSAPGATSAVASLASPLQGGVN
ncbi:hypothetical protein [Nocardioides zeae]